MSGRDELRALAERVMALTGACKVTDCDIAQAVGAQPVSWAQGGGKHWVNWPAFTASLDAAMMLGKMCAVGGAEILRRALAMAGADVDALPRYVTAAALLARAEQVPE